MRKRLFLILKYTLILAVLFSFVTKKHDLMQPLKSIRFTVEALAASAKHIKLLVGVGANDSERLEITKKFAEQLKNNGYQVKFETFPNVGHEVPPAAKQLAIELFREMLK